MNPAWAKLADRVGGSAVGRTLGTWDRWAEAARPPAPVDQVDRILLIKLWGLGNWALLRPIVRDLRMRWPAARLTIVTLEANRSLVTDLADDLHLVRAHSTQRVVRDLARVTFWLRRHRHQLSVDFEQFARTGALLARLGRVQQRLGFATGNAGRDGLYTVTVPYPGDVHASRAFRDLAEAAGLEPGPYRPAPLPVTQAGRAAAARWTLGQPTVVLHPGSGDNFPGRRWSPAGFAALGRAAVAAGQRVILTGTAPEAALAASIAEAIGDGAVTSAGQLDVEGLIALVDEARVVVSNDTAPVHLASQAGTPVLAFYGPNTPVRYGPLSGGSQVMYRALPCSPCLTNASYRSSRCRIHTCMQALPVGTAVGHLQRMLRQAVREVGV